MDDEKRRIIIAEIKYWRQHKLLAEQYCDFLLNLYRTEEANGKQESTGRGGSFASGLKNSNWQAWLAGVASIGLIVFGLLNFAKLGTPLQIGVSLLFVVCCYGIGLLRRDRAPLVAFGVSGVASLALLLAGMYILREAGMGEPSFIIGYIGISGLIWLFAGIAGRMSVLQFCGWIAMLFAYGWMMQGALTLNWGMLELCWLPLSFLFIWIGWLLHHRSKRNARVLMIVGVIIWLLPELHGLFVEAADAMPIMQLSLVGKLIVGAIVLYALRKKWIEWVV